MAAERRERILSSVLLFALAFCCLLLATALLFLSTAPYDLVLRVSRIATGSRNPLSHQQYSVLLPRILPGGLFYGALGAVLLLFHRRLISWTAEGIGALRGCIVQRRQALACWLSGESPWHILSLALITVGGFLIRLKYLGEPPRVDESYTYLVFAGRSLIHVLVLYPGPNNHIFHSALEWISCRVFGDSLWAMRLPAFLAGVALVPSTYLAARRVTERNAALIAAFLVAVSGPLVLYSVNARGYSIQAVLLVLMLYSAAELASAPAAYWLLFSVAAALGFWTSPTMLYSYLIAFAWLLWASKMKLLRATIISGVMTGTGVVFLYMPVLIVSGPRAVLRNPWVQPLPWNDFRAEASQFPKEMLAFLHGGDPLLFAILIGVGVLVTLTFRVPAGRSCAQLLVFLPLVLISVSVVYQIVPFPRVLLPVFVIYYIGAAFGLSILAQRAFFRHEVSMLIALVALLGAIAFHLTRSGYIEARREFPESRAVAEYLGTQLRPCDRLMIGWPAEPELHWQLHHAHIPHLDYSKDATPTRVLVAMQDVGVLPPRPNAHLDPSLLTLDGTLRDAGLNTAEYLPAQLIYRSGQGEVFQLLPVHPSSDCGTSGHH